MCGVARGKNSIKQIYAIGEVKADSMQRAAMRDTEILAIYIASACGGSPRINSVNIARLTARIVEIISTVCKNK